MFDFTGDSGGAEPEPHAPKGDHPPAERLTGEQYGKIMESVASVNMPPGVTLSMSAVFIPGEGWGNIVLLAIGFSRKRGVRAVVPMSLDYIPCDGCLKAMGKALHMTFAGEKR